MADEPLENEELELDDDLEESEEPKKSGGGLKTGLIIVVVQAVVAYFLATMVIVPMLVKNASASETHKSTSDTTAAAEQVEVDSNFVNIGPIFNVEDIIVNPANSEGERYVVLNMALELTNEEAQAEVEKRVPLIRDVAIQLLSSVPVDSMDGAQNKLKLKERFTQEVKKVLPPGTLKRVYFTSFIIQ